MHTHETENTALSQVKDMLSGIAAGLVSKVVEYPFDTIKVFYQSGDLHNTPKSALTYFGQIIREEGFMRLFRGLPAPLFGSCIQNMIMFHGYGAAERYLRQRKSHSCDNHSTLSIFETGLAGMFSGIGTGLWLTPVELIKCKMQTAEQGVYKSTMDCLLQTIRNSPMELSTGMAASLTKESLGCMVYFMSYNSTLRGLQYYYLRGTGDGISVTPPTNWMILVSGAMSGIVFWTIVYPFDTAKTKQQAWKAHSVDGDNHHHRGYHHSMSMIQVMKQKYQRYGIIAGWYRGLLSVTIPRGIISNSLIFLTFEKTRALLDSGIEIDIADLGYHSDLSHLHNKQSLSI